MKATVCVPSFNCGLEDVIRNRDFINSFVYAFRNRVGKMLVILGFGKYGGSSSIVTTFGLDFVTVFGFGCFISP